MDVNELIDNLRMPTWHDLEDPNATLLDDAADALSTFQAENEKLKNAADSWKKKWAGLDKAVRNGSVYRPMQEELNLTHEENQSLKDENEKMRAELDAAIRQLHGHCPACTHYTPNHSEGPCRTCKHEYYHLLNNESFDNWKWRGPHKED